MLRAHPVDLQAIEGLASFATFDQFLGDGKVGPTPFNLEISPKGGPAEKRKDEVAGGEHAEKKKDDGGDKVIPTSSDPTASLGFAVFAPFEPLSGSNEVDHSSRLGHGR